MKAKQKLTLVIGDKNLSSWSMRAWLAAKAAGLPFKEIKIILDRPSTAKEIAKYSPSNRVPCLIHDDTVIWDSLAICEYLAELAPKKNLWPANPAERALARSYTAEMHSSFQSLRDQCSMDIRLKIEIRHLTTGTIKDIRRLTELWSTAMKNSGGPFLFGEFGIVDAFYAPVVFRFLSYGIGVKDPRAKKYMHNMQNYPHIRAWVNEALTEKATPFVF